MANIMSVDCFGNEPDQSGTGGFEAVLISRLASRGPYRGNRGGAERAESSSQKVVQESR